jgi:uncharacterized protein (TIGR03437 family)
MLVPVAATRPGLFPRIWNEDGTLNSPENPASVGSIVVLYATGQGVTSPRSRTGAFPTDGYPEPREATSLRIGGVEAEVIFRGQAPRTTGVMQINARVPQGVTADPAVAVNLSIGGGTSQPGIALAVR